MKDNGNNLKGISAYKKLTVKLPEPKHRCIRSMYILALLLAAFTTVVLFQHFWRDMIRSGDIDNHERFPNVDDVCQMQLVESIPENLNYSVNSPKFMSTYEAWKILLNSTVSALNIGSFYWTLLGSDVINDTSAAQGEDIFANLMHLGMEGKVKIRIAQSEPTEREPDKNTIELSRQGAAEVRSVNFTRLVGGGVLHTKFWISDHKHIYLGSANMDWRSLTQVKEMGVLVSNCSSLAMDLEKIFEEYWLLGNPSSTIPAKWPHEYSTQFNFKNPMNLFLNNEYRQPVILSSSPPPLTADGREDDITAILEIISSAKKFVNIAVMDYYPLMIYSKEKTYWPVIDDALRSAAINRKIQIKLLISWWKHSDPSEDYFLKSLQALSYSLPDVDIRIKRFIVPSNEHEAQIPYGRVNHNKYMVTDNVAYIGTSNWSGDYFTNTAGVGLVLMDTPEMSNMSTIRKDLLSVFERDWNSEYSKDLELM
ncbi:5'-3' exonuclease PLD3-like [Haematobia irritans]|uniref:5'-3' exonuclease PLD3-like n=1 Tax=Haematobia irritans TaxID=7368 RepID=UPI003F4F6D51